MIMTLRSSHSSFFFDFQGKYQRTIVLLFFEWENNCISLMINIHKILFLMSNQKLSFFFLLRSYRNFILCSFYALHHNNILNPSLYLIPNQIISCIWLENQIIKDSNWCTYLPGIFLVK